MFVGSPKYFCGFLGLKNPLCVLIGLVLANSLSDTRLQTSQDELSVLEQDYGTSGGAFVFPADVGSSGNFAVFRISKDNQFRRQAISLADTKVTIFLPLPLNLQTAYNAQYNAEGLGPLAGFGAGMAGSVKALAEGGGGQNFAQSLVDQFDLTKEGKASSFREGLGNLAVTAVEEQIGTVAAVATGGVGAGVAAAAATQAFKAGMAGAGIAKNPHLATLFTGVNFRTFTFVYKFLPRNEFESSQVTNIIKQFKYHMAPSYSKSGHFFNYPEQFDIEFIGSGDNLFEIGACALTGLDVNYHSEGAPFYFKDTKAPASVTISMTFQELTINTKENIARDNR